MTFLVHDVWYTLQGEGAHLGRPAVFCRFSKCNLWTGVEKDRHRAICTFCDTNFLSYEELEQDDLVSRIEQAWPKGQPGTLDRHWRGRLVVFTGGEPALQLTEGLVHQLHLRDFFVAVETNGTRDLPPNLDWICVSPKTRRLRIRKGNELKLVYPQGKLDPSMFAKLDFDRFSISPMDMSHLDGADRSEANTAAAVEYVLAHPQWRLTIQVHKMIGVR